jgi:hypothetical protein
MSRNVDGGASPKPCSWKRYCMLSLFMLYLKDLLLASTPSVVYSFTGWAGRCPADHDCGRYSLSRGTFLAPQTNRNTHRCSNRNKNSNDVETNCGEAGKSPDLEVTNLGFTPGSGYHPVAPALHILTTARIEINQEDRNLWYRGSPSRSVMHFGIRQCYLSTFSSAPSCRGRTCSASNSYTRASNPTRWSQ